jgi:hypothetical protein
MEQTMEQHLVQQECIVVVMYRGSDMFSQKCHASRFQQSTPKEIKSKLNQIISD